MDILNLTSTTLTAGSALAAPGLYADNAALNRLQPSQSPAQVPLENLLSETILRQNLKKLMDLFTGLMKNDGATSVRDGSASGGSTSGAAPVDPTSVKKTAKATGTGYYPDSSALEGGYVDKKGKKLNTLQDFLAGKADYVSVAMDDKAGIPYGAKLRIPELEKKYGKPIDFRVVDTGGAFGGKGNSRIDICTANEKASTDSTINGPLTLQFV